MQVWDIAARSAELERSAQVDLEQGSLAADPAVCAGHVVVLQDLDGHHRYALVEKVARTTQRVRYTFFLGERFEAGELESLALSRPDRAPRLEVSTADIESLLDELRPSRRLAPSGR